MLEGTSYSLLYFHKLQHSRFAILFLKSLGNSAPVDDVPDGAKVLSLAVLVLQVVGVLPGVNAHQRLDVAGDWVPVGACDDAESARGLVLDEPGPAGALDAGEQGVGLLLEVVKGAKVFVDGGLQSTLALDSSFDFIRP